LLQQHGRALLIACKSSNVVQAQIMEPLQAVTQLLGPAIQVGGT